MPITEKNGLHHYAAEQRDLLATIKAEGGTLTADRFDELYLDKEFRISWSGDAPLLGSMSQGDWACWLDLLQRMAHAGAVTITKNPITYKEA